MLGRREEIPMFPVVTTLLVTVVTVALIWQPQRPTLAKDRFENQFRVESPMGSWVSLGRPTARLNGTIEFRDRYTGDKIQIDNGGVVITPYRADD